ncbi:response regulator [Opitutus terrae]|uniref:Response regulator receiver protein n=1 Tax=Opitutus terrae (strain DSM 11246 / JCM 15787 / PB90-1) TaxID=452637 RepID=B1ZWU5_OPITP|nr:response regulator [Opitutus terrae]ACB74222.1 response regulator receiver protein [Opitutus terrae PB90-1]
MSDPKRILLAEDSPQDIEMTLSALSDYRLTNEIVVVNDGEQALDYLYARGAFADRVPGNPVVVLLDLKMPKVDGLEVLRTIKQDEQLRTTPVVMLTSSREEQDVVRSYRLGTNAYVVKPVDFHCFIEAVKQLGAFWTIHNEPPPRMVVPGAGRSSAESRQ